LNEKNIVYTSINFHISALHESIQTNPSYLLKDPICGGDPVVYCVTRRCLFSRNPPGIHRQSTWNSPYEKLLKLLINPAHLKNTLKADSRWIPTNVSLNVAKSMPKSYGKLDGIHLESTFKVFFRFAGFTNNFGNFSEGGCQVYSRWILGGFQKQNIDGSQNRNFQNS